MRKLWRRIWEVILKRLIQLSGILAILFVILILLFLLRDALPSLRENSLSALLTGPRWSPTAEPARFGLLPLLLGSLYVTAGALLIAVPLGLACAVFIAEVVPASVRELLKPLVELLAAIPSVVYGLIGLLLVGPWLKELLNLPLSQFAALGSLILAFMALPTMVSVSEDALRAVPRVLRYSSLALGATRWQTICRVTVPAARSGIIAAVLLGLGRVIGETMTVLMVTGNAPVIPEGVKGFFRPLRTMTATIAAEMGETAHNTPHYHALFMIGLVLFLITLVINLLSDFVIKRMPGVRT